MTHPATRKTIKFLGEAVAAVGLLLLVCAWLFMQTDNEFTLAAFGNAVVFYVAVFGALAVVLNLIYRATSIAQGND